MNLSQALTAHPFLLMEGALGERLRHECQISYSHPDALAGMVYLPEAKRALLHFWSQYLDVAEKHGLPLLATTPTRCANRERVAASGHSASIFRYNVELVRQVGQSSKVPVLAGGLVGCKGDAYFATEVLSAEESLDFHSWEVEHLGAAGVDFFFAGILPALSEAIGLARAIAATKAPYIISFMVGRDGRLIDGTPLSAAMEAIDNSAPIPPVGYMVNCVHPRVLFQGLSQPINRHPVIRKRFLGIQANTSPLSPQELDGSSQLRTSPPAALADEIHRLQELFPLKIVGGCCGTDHRHIRAIAERMTQDPCTPL